MSQFNLTPEEDQMLLDALRAHAVRYEAMYSAPETTMLALIAKIESQLPQPAPAVEQPENEPTAEEVEAHFAAEETAEEKPVKAKKAK